MTLDLAWNAEQQAIADAVAKLCRDRATRAAVEAAEGRFPRELWSALAELGFLALGTPEGGGGALEIVATCEALGAALFPGPVAETFLATHVLDGADRDAIAAGELVVSVGEPPLMPWAPVADRFLSAEGWSVRRGRPIGTIEPFDSLGGDPWGRVQMQPIGEVLPLCDGGLTLHDVGLAAYLAAAGRALVGTAAEHARGRVQFGKPLGKFQAVAHPLADCAMRLSAAATLARAAAFHFDREAWIEARRYGAAARLSAASAAREAGAVCHQVFGAIGITLEGPAYRFSRRIEQLAASPVGLSRARSVNAPVLSAWRDRHPEMAGGDDENEIEDAP